VKKIALLSIASMTLAMTARADFEKGNQELAAGNYKAAIGQYEAEVKSGRWSANLFYNLGNAYFHADDIGRAILNYERALELEPHHPEAQTNLEIAREKSRGLEMTPGPVEKYLGKIGTSTLAITAVVCFWIGVILLIVRQRAAAIAAGIACLILSAVSVWAAWTLDSATRGAAIIVTEDAQARVATADTARSVLALPPGSEVVILQERGNWSYASLPNDQRGWIAAKAAEKVRL
jgi:tetratricopeptide (TPR) repeat protein